MQCRCVGALRDLSLQLPPSNTDPQAVAPPWGVQPAPDVQYLLLHDLFTVPTLHYYEDQLERLRTSGVEAGLRNAPNAAAVSELTAQRTQMEQVVAFLRSRLAQIDDERFDASLLDINAIDILQVLMNLEERRLGHLKQLMKYAHSFTCIIVLSLYTYFSLHPIHLC